MGVDRNIPFPDLFAMIQHEKDNADRFTDSERQLDKLAEKLEASAEQVHKAEQGLKSGPSMNSKVMTRSWRGPA